MSYTECSTGSMDALVDLSYSPDLVHRLPQDTTGGPQVGFVPGNSGDMLVLFEGRTTYDQAVNGVVTHDTAVTFVDTSEGWNAFLAEITSEGSVDYLDSPIVMLCDANCLNEAVLVFSAQQFSAFVAAVKAGKYAIPAQPRYWRPAQPPLAQRQ